MQPRHPTFFSQNVGINAKDLHYRTTIELVRYSDPNYNPFCTRLNKTMIKFDLAMIIIACS